MTDEYILVLGSKPESKLPDVKVKKIYSANGAAERAVTYKKKYPNIEHIALIGSKEFSENEEVKSRVIKSKPDALYCRSGEIVLPQELNHCKLSFLTKEEQFAFQSKFYDFGSFDIILGESFFYETNPIKLLKHIYACCKYRGFWGVATGFYSILLALYENPTSSIIVSGVGLVEGGHYYTTNQTYGYISLKDQKLIKDGKKVLSNKFRNTSRCRVERYLIKRIKNKLKKRIYSVDAEMVEKGNVKKWEGNIF